MTIGIIEDDSLLNQALKLRCTKCRILHHICIQEKKRLIYLLREKVDVFY